MEKIIEALQILSDYKIDIFNHSIFAKRLTSNQFSIMMVLISEPEKVFTRKELIEKAWDKKNSNDVTLRTIDVHIKRIREAFGNPYHNSNIIETVHTTGYRLSPYFVERLKRMGTISSNKNQKLNSIGSEKLYEVENRVFVG